MILIYISLSLNWQGFKSQITALLAEELGFILLIGSSVLAAVGGFDVFNKKAISF